MLCGTSAPPLVSNCSRSLLSDFAGDGDGAAADTCLLWEKLEEEMSRRVAAAVTVWPEDVSAIWEENQRRDRGHTKVVVGKCSEIPSGPRAKSFFLLFKHIPVVQHTGGQETAETPRPR